MKSVFLHIDKKKQMGVKEITGKAFFSILSELMFNDVYKSKASFLDKYNNT
jgi:hypothetical protein